MVAYDGLRVSGAGGSEQHIQCVFELSWEATERSRRRPSRSEGLSQVSSQNLGKGGGAKKEFYVFG